MANSNSGGNQINVPQAKDALNNMKYEIARELGVNLKQGYNGDLTSVRPVTSAVTWSSASSSRPSTRWRARTGNASDCAPQVRRAVPLSKRKEL